MTLLRLPEGLIHLQNNGGENTPEQTREMNAACVAYLNACIVSRHDYSRHNSFGSNMLEGYDPRAEVFHAALKLNSSQAALADLNPPHVSHDRLAEMMANGRHDHAGYSSQVMKMGGEKLVKLTQSIEKDIGRIGTKANELFEQRQTEVAQAQAKAVLKHADRITTPILPGIGTGERPGPTRRTL